MSSETSHIVHLFDTAASLTETVARLVQQSAEGALALVITRPRNWARIARRLTRAGVDTERAIQEGRPTMVDASRLLASFMRRAAPEPELFEQHVGELLAGLSHNEPELRVYNEMAEILAEEGNFEAACQVEGLWNRLMARHPFTLLCGYSAAHFITPSAQAHLKTICGAHSHVDYKTRDTLSKWLLRDAPDSAATLPKTRRAQRLISRLVKHSAFALTLSFAIPV